MCLGGISLVEADEKNLLVLNEVRKMNRFTEREQ